jgi:hypothetical protein
MIVRDPIWIDPTLTGLYIIESGIEPTKDLISGKKVFGVQLISLDDILDKYLNSYFGDIYYVQVNTNRNDLFYHKLKQTIRSVDGKPYDLNPVDWIKAKFDIEIGNLQKENTFWCSALLSYLYVRLDLLPDSTPWTIIPPYKFSQYSTHKLLFQNSVVSPEKKIVNLNRRFRFLCNSIYF